MTSSYSTTSSFTRTNAVYLASKVAADLRQMQRFYGRPTDDEIDQYLDEIIILVLGGYLKSVDYGFRKDNKWVVALSYAVSASGSIVSDDRSGRVPVGVDISGASWWSYLRKSSAFYDLSPTDRQRIEDLLPISRTVSPEIQAGNGQWVSDKTYSSGGTDFQRRSFQPY